MLRRLRELDRLDARTGGVQALWAGSDQVPDPVTFTGAPMGGGALDPARRERRRRRRVRLATVLVVAMIAGLYLQEEYGLRLTRAGITGFHRLGPVPDPGVGGAHTFAQSHDGAPVTYSPCRPLEVVVNRALEPAGAAGVVEEAVTAVADATGLVIEVTGSSDEAPSDDRLLRQPVRYGGGWAPVLVAWTTPHQVPGLSGDVVGLGGSAAVADSGIARPRYVTGTVSLDTPALTGMLARPRGRDLVRAVVMHELGHVVGLGHVDDPGELMYADNVGRTDFGPGDVAGLAELGSGPCT